MHQQSDPKTMLSLAAEGDRHSFGEFYELFLNEIYRYIFFRVNDHDEAEDLAEKVFLEAWENLTGIRRGKKIENIRAWIYRIARNKVIDHHRTRKPVEPIDNNPDKKLRSNWLESDLDDFFTSEKLVEAVRQLPENYQEVIILRFINQMSHADVAAILNATESNVRVLQFRALQQMREIMSEVNHE